MEISKSTPYVRYRENISSSLHKGTVHIESEYLDRERKTTIESIEGQTWQNVVVQENREEDLLPRLVLQVDGNTDIIDTKEERMPIDVIHGYTEPVANEDGTYTYEISTMEGSYAKTLDGENNFSLTSDGLDGEMYIKYNAQGEEVNGNIVMTNGQKEYTIENSITGEIKSAILKGQTLVNIMKKIDKMDVHQSRKDDDTYIEGNYFVFDLNKTDVDVAQNRYMQKNNSTTHPLEQGKTYTLLINIEENISSLSSHTFMSVRVNFSNGTSSALNIKGDGSVGIQKFKFKAISSEITTLFVNYYPNSEVRSGKIRMSKDIMLLEGDYTNVDIPYFEGMQSVKLPVLTTQNSTIKITDFELGATDANGNITLSSTGDNLSPFFKISPQKKYNIKFNNFNKISSIVANYYDENKNFISRVINPASIQTPQNCHYCVIRFFSNPKRTGNVEIYLGENYEPYKSNILTVNEEVELRGIGEVKDTLDCLTGEVTQRIGEIVLDGSEDWTKYQNTFYTGLDTLPRDSDYTSIIMCSDLPVVPTVSHLVNANKGVTGYTKNSSYVGENWVYVKFEDVNDVDALKMKLSENPITVQYQLATEVVKTIDLTIKDQDNKIIQSLHTHPSTTHINLSSDGLIPSAELSYTLLKSTGEASGTSIQFDNGKASDLISGIVYGESLVNALPSPSLKNSMSNISMQRLNNGYDNINVVDGEFKKATLYGQTLVNIFQDMDYVWNNLAKQDDFNYVDGELIILNNGNHDGRYWDLVPKIPNVKPNTEYTLIFTKGSSPRLEFGTVDENGQTSSLGIHYNVQKTKIISPNNGDLRVKFSVNNPSSSESIINLGKAMLLEGDYTNQDIPYFDGMQSVQYPSLTTCGKNIFNAQECELDTSSHPKLIMEAPTKNSIRVALLEDLTQWRRGGIQLQLESNTWYKVRCTVEGNGVKELGFSIPEMGTNYNPDVNNCKESNNFLGHFRTQESGIVNLVFNGSGNTAITFDLLYKDIQIERVESSTINHTTYEPYKSTTLTVNEEIILHKVGDVQDELNLSTGKLTQRIGEIVLDGSESWGLNSTEFSDGYIFQASLPSKAVSTDIICDKLPVKNLWSNNSGEGISLSGSLVFVQIKHSTITTADEFKTWLVSNPITLQYTVETPTTRQVNLSIVDQDGVTQSKLQSYANGHINVQSQGLLPSVNYEVPTNNSYYLDLVKTNTQYTSKGSSDCNATIDGTSYPLSANGTFTTPSTITDNLMVLDAQVDDLMFIEGDLTGKNINYFTGISSVENPLVTVSNGNLWGQVKLSENWDDYTHNAYGDSLQRILKLEPNTRYRINNILRVKGGQIVFNLTERQADGSLKNWFSHNRNNTTNDIIEYTSNVSITTTTGNIYLQCFPFQNENQFEWAMETIKRSSVTIFKEGDYEDNTMIQPESLHLTTTPQITLNGIGDVKDEWDVVNETITRRIGKIVLDGSEHWLSYSNHFYYNSDIFTNETKIICDKLPTAKSMNEYGVMADNGIIRLKFNDNNDTVDTIKNKLTLNPLTIYYTLKTPTTELVRITPQNPQESSTSITLDTALQKVGNVSDQLRWNPYKGHYVRYNYIQDGVANSTYTFEDLKDMNERKFVNLYNERTYIDTDHSIESRSYGISIPTIAEQGKQYQVRWDYVETPSVDTIKVDLCGNVKEIPSTDNSVIIDVDRYTHSFVQIQAERLTGKITNVMVIETVNGEIPDVDFFSGIQCVGNVVQVDGVNKAEIVIEQTNGNLIDVDYEITNNGNNVGIPYTSLIRPNKNYILKTKEGNTGGSYCYVGDKNKNMLFSIGLGANEITEIKVPYNGYYFRFHKAVTSNGSVNMHYPFELCYADMAKDGIRPRYYDKESIILPMKLCRVGNIYDNLYYDDLKGYYRIQQSIGHKYFTGETTEVWTMETTNGYRTIKFTCTSANIDQIAYSGTICNQWKHLSTINDDMEGFIIYNGNFVIRIDKDRLTDKTVDGFKTLLASSPIHLFYQLKTPQMINLTEYPNRIELNTYRDEIFTFFKNMNPTKFTLSVPMDKTYRYEIEEEGQGLANRVTVNNETISAENMVAVKEVRGQGIANIIEDVDNVVITPRPNHGGKSTSHTLNNTKPATIRVHGFEPSGDTAIGTYNTTDKAYQLKVMSSNGDNSLSDYYVLNVPYKLETYADGTKDVVYYDEAYKQWHFKGSSVKEYTVASDGALSETIEIFRGLAPRSGMIAEFKLMFTSGTTAARMYYSLDGVTYGYTQLRNMSDGNYLYVGIFNTGGTKIDIAYKTDPNAEYTNLVPLSTQVPECFMVNQITNCTFCELTLDKQYIYSEMKSPIELETYEGSTKVFMDGNATDTNIIIRNEGTTKIVNTYTDTDYTVYWKYVDGLGNLRVTLGGTTVEVDGKQEYVTLKTQLNAPQELLYVGGYNLSIKDLMVVKGAKIDDLPYFEGSRQVGTLVLDEEGNKSYKITLVQGGSVLEQRDENAITFKDDNKHNVVVHKIVGVCPTKVD